MTHYVRPPHHELPRGTRQDGLGHDGASLNRRPRPSTAPPGLFAPAPEVVVEKAAPKKRVHPTVATGRPSRAKDGPPQRKVAEHGTLAGYHRHSRTDHTPPCEPCKAAKNQYERARHLPKAPKPPVECGSTAGYRRHRYAGEPTCDPCRDANAQAKRDERARRRDAA